MQDWKMTEIKSAGVSVIRRQFLRAISHSLGAHTDAFDIAVEITDDECNDEQQLQQQPDQATTTVTPGKP